jgi:hypothetical protein
MALPRIVTWIASLLPGTRKVKEKCKFVPVLMETSQHEEE